MPPFVTNAISTTQQSIAFSDGEDVHFANAVKFTRMPGRVCRRGRRGGSGGNGSDGRTMVTALAFDAVSTGVLYVGFGSGEVMVRASVRPSVRACMCCAFSRIPCSIVSALRPTESIPELQPSVALRYSSCLRRGGGLERDQTRSRPPVRRNSRSVARMHEQAYDSRLQEADGSYTCLPSHRLPPPPQQPVPSSYVIASSAAVTAGLPRLTSTKDSGGGGGTAIWREGACDSISTVRGYTIVSQGSLLSVYNTTDGSDRLLFTRQTADAAAAAAAAATKLRQDDYGFCEGEEKGGAAGVPAGGRMWSVMSSSASGEVLMAEASRCSAVSLVSRSFGCYHQSPYISLLVAGLRSVCEGAFDSAKLVLRRPPLLRGLYYLVFWERSTAP